MKTITTTAVAIVIAIEMASCQGIKTVSSNQGGKPEISNSDLRKIKRLSTAGGWEPDWDLGTTKNQVRDVWTHRNQVDDNGKNVWILENLETSSGDKTIAMVKNRDYIRSEFGKNAFNSIYGGQIEHGGVVENATGEDISPELKDAVTVATEVFEAELSKNIVIARFFKLEGKKYWVKTTVAMNVLELDANIKKLTKMELRARIAAVRGKYENAGAVTQKKNEK